IEAITHAPSALVPSPVLFPVLVALEPRRSDSTFDLPTAVAELRFIEGAALMLSHDDRGARVSRGHADSPGGSSPSDARNEGSIAWRRPPYTPWVPRGYHLAVGTALGTKRVEMTLFLGDLDASTRPSLRASGAYRRSTEPKVGSSNLSGRA